MNSGWICPKCGSVYAPFVWECQRCNNPQQHYGTGTGDPIPPPQYTVSSTNPLHDVWGQVQMTRIEEMFKDPLYTQIKVKYADLFEKNPTTPPPDEDELDFYDFSHEKLKDIQEYCRCTHFRLVTDKGFCSHCGKPTKPMESGP